ncbi:MAG: hypothetical protein HQL45_13470 [Alphaproteobacteria bacterium]|nr:hypothetical protein [Alphaproteobacteria bacterium]
MTRSRRSLMFLRTGLLCLLLVGLCGEAHAEWRQYVGWEGMPKLTKNDKTYIQRMIKRWTEEKPSPGRDWLHQPCRNNSYGTWFPPSRTVSESFGRTVLTPDSIIFEELGVYPYEYVQSEEGKKSAWGGVRERYIFKLKRPFYYKAFVHEPAYIVFRSQSWNIDDDDNLYRCMSQFVLCPSLESAETEYGNTSNGFSSADCGVRVHFHPYPIDK